MTPNIARNRLILIALPLIAKMASAANAAGDATVVNFMALSPDAFFNVVAGVVALFVLFVLFLARLSNIP